MEGWGESVIFETVNLQGQMREMKKILLLLLVLFSGCRFDPGIKIDRSSVRIHQGKYYGDIIELSFSTGLTGVIVPEEVYWNRNDGRFHLDELPSDGITFYYEVFNPFGESELKLLSDGVGPSKPVQLPLPVFWSEEYPYEYTLEITFYINARVQDRYRANFRLMYPK